MFRPQSIAYGVLAGFIATGPMTVAMMLLHRKLAAPERYPLPPREITEALIDKGHPAGMECDELSESAMTGITLGSHFLYGAVAGGAFAAIERFLPAPRTVKGVAFGVLVWTASYLAWIPALGILAPATEHPPRRNALMIAAHVVWGAVTGLVLDRLEDGVRLSGIGRVEDR